jgi:hypothetical protein
LVFRNPLQVRIIRVGPDGEIRVEDVDRAEFERQEELNGNPVDDDG